MGSGSLYVGIDGHKNFSFLCAMTKEGEIIEEKKVRNEEIEKIIEELGLDNLIVIIEPTTTTYPLVRGLRKKTEIKLAHPQKTKLIAESKKKTDKVDARVLADLARTNFLPTAYLPPDEIIELRDIVRERVRLKKLSTSIKNRIHSILMIEGIKCNNPFTSEGIKFLKSLNDGRINRYLRILNTINEEIKEIDREIREKCIENEEIMILTTIPGIGYFSALLIYAEIGDINRFPNSKKLCSYAGLVPAVRQSGNRVIRGRITKEGNKLLRWVLVQCAYVAVRKDERFKEFYNRIKQRKGPQKAIVATARKLLTVVYACWKNRTPYGRG